MSAQTQPKTAVKIVFGCMTFGPEGVEQARVHGLDTCHKILDTFAAHGHNELDCARMYCKGESEGYLRQLGVTKPDNPHNFQVATKSYPSARNPNFPSEFKYTHEPEDIHRCIDDSLKKMGTDSFDLFYLHAPDREVPLEKTHKAVDEAYKAGKFKRFGISNYRADEVETFVQNAEKNGWVKPVAFQGVFNCLTRSAEPELLPVLRKHGISFYTFNPLGGGMLVGGHSQEGKVEEGSRFDPNRAQGQMYRKRYWNDHYFQAIEQLKPAAEKHNLTLAEIALRWEMHHSALSKEHGDAVIIGASSTNHIEQNLLDFEKGPLPDDVVEAVDRAWKIVEPHAPPYHH